MTWVFAILVGLVLAGVAVVASGRVGHLPPTEARLGAVPPQDGPLDASSLRTVRFSLAIRGYRMDEVDALLDRLAAEMERREARDGA